MKNDWKRVFPSGQSRVTAVDILLEPDAAMLQHAAANNARLLKEFPKGFALDATHTPHITMLQCFVRTADFDKLFNPHVSTGVARREYLDKMLAEPFEAFTFSPTGAAVYQLGPFGTAAMKLKEWN